MWASQAGSPPPSLDGGRIRLPENFIGEFTVGDPRAFPFLSVAAAFAIAECVPLPSMATDSTSPVVSQPVPEQASPNCRNFTMPVMVEGQQRQAVGQMCQQPDGSWRVTQNTPGLPLQVYTLPAQVIYVTPYPCEYYWADPWGYGPPFFAGGLFFFDDDFHHFRHQRFFHGGFHRAFHNGFHGGFRGGFHGGGHR
jgi:hypothetical protein